MNDFVISITGDVLKLTVHDKSGVQFSSATLPQGTIVNSVVTDVNNFRVSFDKLMAELAIKNPNKYSLHVLVDPKDVLSIFVLTDKKVEDVDRHIVDELKKKLGNIALDTVYFSYQKIAPFVFQVLVVERKLLDSYLQLSSVMNISLAAVVPWASVLPKYTERNEQCIFVYNDNNCHYVILSELGGVYFSQLYTKDSQIKDITKIVRDLSVYGRSQPIKRVFTLNYDDFAPIAGYEIAALKVSDSSEDINRVFALNLLYYSVLDTTSVILSSQLNMLGMLPLPVVEKKSLPAVIYIGSGLTVVGALVVLGVFVPSLFGSAGTPAVVGNPQVLGEEVKETSATPPVQPPKILKKDALKIRVENGAGTSGLASKARDFVVSKGYSVVGIGNAATSGRTDTLVRLSNDTADYKSMIENDLKSAYKLVFETNLEATSEYNVLIIVGSN